MNNLNISQSTYTETILIVDDMPDNLRLLSLMLESQGYQVKKAINGKFALQSLEIVLPDLILLDINMPEIDGYEVCRRLKAQEKTKFIPVIFISAFNEILDKVKAFQVGGVDYIVKPFQVEEVLIRIENQLNQRRLYNQLQVQNERLQIEIAQRQKAEAALSAANHQLELLAAVDGLMGIPNRRKFDEFLSSEWQRLFRGHLPLSLLLLDVDFFKKYNDNYGHLAGDDCLKKVANTIKSSVKRGTDLVARYGGEEFAVILSNTDLSGATFIAENIRATIENLKIPHVKSEIADFLTLSIGIATVIPNSAVKHESLIAIADQALYAAKNQGRNRIIALASE